MDNIVAKCGDKIPDKMIDKFYIIGQVAVLGRIGGLMGGYWGVLFQYKFFQGRSKFKEPTKYVCPKTLARGVLLSILFTPFESISKFVAQDANIWVHIIVLNFFLYAVLYFILFAFSDTVMAKIRLINKRIKEEKVETTI